MPPRGKSRSKSVGGKNKTPKKSTPKQRSTRSAAKGFRQKDFKYDDDEIYGDVDKFAQQEDTVGLDVEKDENSDSSDPDNDVNPDSIMALEYEGQSNSDDSDEDSDDSENEAQKMMMEDYEEAEEMKRRRAIEEEENLSKNWGSKKKAYYSADTADYELESDDEDAQLEEQEAIRLQKEKYDQMEEDDFEDDMLGAIVKSKDKKKGKSSKKAKGKASKKGDEEDEDEDEEEDDGVLDINGLDLGQSGLQAERINRDLDSLTQQEKMEIIVAESPELLGLLEEFKENMLKIRKHLHPTLKKLRALKLPTNKGLSFLEVKYHLLLNYCTNITFYLLLKTEGVHVKDHPVIKQLVRLRAVIEKIKPIEKKLKYQIDKLLKIAADPEAASRAVKDPMSFRPNVSNLVEDEEEGIPEGVYRPPKLAAVSMMDKDEKKREKKRQKALKKASKSSIIQQLRNELSEAPEEVSVFGEGERKVDERVREITDFEEENFLRLVETKKDKARKKQQNKQRIGAFDDFDDFGDLHVLTEKQEDEDLGVDQLRSKRKHMSAKDDEADLKMFDEFSDDEDLEEGAAMYESQAKKSREKKKAKLEMYERPKVYMRDNADVADGKRSVGKDIMKNRGLTPNRRRDTKTAKTKNRFKYDKALKKRRSQVQEYKGHQKNDYGGKTGIKSNLVKSRSLKD